MRGMGRIFKMKGSKNWWIAYCHRGIEHRESCGSPDLKVAKDLLKQRVQQMGADVLGLKAFVGPVENRITVDNMLDALQIDHRLRRRKALPQLQSHLKPLREYFGNRRAVDVTSDVVDRYIEIRSAEKSPATVNRELSLLRQAFRIAIRHRKLTMAPEIRRLEESNVRQGFFEAADFENVVGFLPEYLKGVACFGYLSGWRKGEIQSLLWNDVDREACVIRLRPENSKTGEGRVLALEGELWDMIERQWEARQYKRADGTVAFSLYVFHLDGAPIGDFRKAWGTACQKANVPGKLFHDLRRTAVRNMIRASVPERVAMSISGHKTRAIFDRYNIVSEEDLRQAAKQTQSYLKSVQSKSKVAIIGKKKENR
ncbi:MAG: site-specific integrase [Acidobacteria bacterium]|nr:site-specific integrase [Acidobacteriota bacterium]